MYEKLYNNKYALAFYENDDETFLFMVNNIKELCDYLKMEPTHNNLNLLQVKVFRGLRRSNHVIRFNHGKRLHVYLIDITEN